MKRILAPLVLVLAATSCAGPSAQPAAPAASSAAPTTEAPKALKPGSYASENSTGTKGTLQIPGQPGAEIEKLRSPAENAPAVT